MAVKENQTHCLMTNIQISGIRSENCKLVVSFAYLVTEQYLTLPVQFSFLLHACVSSAYFASCPYRRS